MPIDQTTINTTCSVGLYARGPNKDSFLFRSKIRPQGPALQLFFKRLNYLRRLKLKEKRRTGKRSSPRAHERGFSMLENERHFRSLGCLTFLVSVWCALSLWAGARNLFALEAKLSIENVRLDRDVLSPGGTVNLSFYLPGDAKVTVLIHGPNYEVVRRLMDGQPRPAGVNGVTWDGRDDSGRMVPDEAYLVAIVAEGPGGERAVYDPTTFSGGEAVEVPIQKVEESSGQYKILYSLPAPSRISIRAGIQKGPLLRTILDQAPQTAGEHAEVWDGMDETGRILVMKEPKRTVQVSGFLLPKGSIIVQGSGTDYSSYHQSLKAISAPSEKSSFLSYQNVRQNALKRADQGISQQFLVRQALNVAPRFRVHLSGDPSFGLAQTPRASVSGQAGLIVEVAPESLYAFNELRYEIVVFIDNERFDEEEQAYPSYNYVLDTRRLSNGEHWVTINLVSMTGQIGSYSFRLDVRN